MNIRKYIPATPKKHTTSLFTKICLWLIGLCLAFYCIGIFILSNTEGFEGLIAIYPLWAASLLSIFLVIASVIHLIFIFTRRFQPNKKVLLVIVLPLLIAVAQPAWYLYQTWKYDKEYKAANTLIDGHYRSNEEDKLIREISAVVYMPNWKTGRAVDVEGNKTFSYLLKYAPNQPDNVHRDGEPDTFDDLPNAPEYFQFYVHSLEEEIKKYVNPPHNCDIEYAIRYAKNINDKPLPRTITCVPLGKNVQDADIYGQNNWLNNELHKYAVTIFDGNSLHLIHQFGTVEKQVGGELQQLLDWQNSFRWFNPDHFGRNDE